MKVELRNPKISLTEQFAEKEHRLLCEVVAQIKPRIYRHSPLARIAQKTYQVGLSLSVISAVIAVSMLISPACLFCALPFVLITDCVLLWAVIFKRGRKRKKTYYIK